MPLLKQHPRKLPRNRKKGGKSGGFVFAAFVIVVLLLTAGGYFLNEYLNSRPVPQQKTTDSGVKALPKRDSTIEKPVDITEETEAKDTAEEPDYSPDDALDDLVTRFYDKDVTDPASQKPKGKPQLAIIIDDLGNSKADAAALADIGVPITFSVIPGLRFDGEVADLARNRKVEVIVHMPMQSKAYPQRRMESNGLLLAHTAKEVQSRTLKALQDLPQAVGLSNHTGSAFTEDAVRMKAMLEVLKQHKLFFVDSVTTPDSAGYRVAKQLGIPTVRRDVFLDNEQNEQYISGQLEQAVQRAVKAGHAVAIGHPHSSTIAVLVRQLPLLKAKGVELVYVSKLVF
jgi:polysaccharide deacetylase 2 family uncharacterized protein YibQ